MSCVYFYRSLSGIVNFKCGIIIKATTIQLPMMVSLSGTWFNVIACFKTLAPFFRFLLLYFCINIDCPVTSLSNYPYSYHSRLCPLYANFCENTVFSSSTSRLFRLPETTPSCSSIGLATKIAAIPNSAAPANVFKWDCDICYKISKTYRLTVYQRDVCYVPFHRYWFHLDHRSRILHRRIHHLYPNPIHLSFHEHRSHCRS